MSDRRFGMLLLLPALLLLGVFLVGPIVYAIFTSLHLDSPVLGREFVGFENYAELLGDATARATIGFTFFFVAVSTCLEVLLGLLIALVVHESFRGRGLVRAAMLVPWAVPTVVAAVMWKYMWNDRYGLVNLVLFGDDTGSYRAFLADPWSARTAVILADVWKTAAFAGLLILAGLQTLPGAIYEAARIDGAGPFRRFFTITLPLLRPAILLAVLFRVMDAFRVFDLVYVMTGGGPGDATNVLQYYGYEKMFPEQRFGYGSAVSVVVFVIIAAISLALVRMLGARVLEEA